MATPQMSPRGDDQIKLTGGPVVFALRFTTGKNVMSKFPGGRVMFTAVDERKLFLCDEEANEFEHALLDLRIEPAEFIRVTRVTHGRGGGFSIRVERIEDDPDPPAAESPLRHGPARAAAPTKEAPTKEEALLEKSIPLARAHGATAFHAPKQRPVASEEETTGRKNYDSNQDQPDHTPAPPASTRGTMSALLAGALCAAIDAYAIADEYARTKGYPTVEFTAEDVRCSANTFLIQYWRDGGTR